MCVGHATPSELMVCKWAFGIKYGCTSIEGGLHSGHKNYNSCKCH